MLDGWIGPVLWSPRRRSYRFWRPLVFQKHRRADGAWRAWNWEQGCDLNARPQRYERRHLPTDCTLLQIVWSRRSESNTRVALYERARPPWAPAHACLRTSNL